MIATEERLAHLEGRVTEHSRMFMGLRETIAHFEQRVDRRFEQIEARLTALDQKIDQKVFALDQKLDQTRVALDTRIGALDVKVDDLHRKSDARFRWLIGLLVSCLIGILLAGFKS